MRLPQATLLARMLIAPFLLVSVSAVAAPLASCEARPIAHQQVMSDDRFWAIIERSVADEGDPARQLETLHAALSELRPDEIEAFEEAFWRQMNRAYTWELWGAAYVVHGGASDDAFEYFRTWLVSKGRSAFERALASPDDLADLLVADVEGVLEFEEFAYVAGNVWRGQTGRRLDEFSFRSGAVPLGAAPQGTRFQEDDAYLSTHYPKLWRRFGENPLG